MANTKKLDHDARKAKKRATRKKLKAAITALTYKERKELHRFEGAATKFLRDLAAKKAAPKEEKAE